MVTDECACLLEVGMRSCTAESAVAGSALRCE